MAQVRTRIGLALSGGGALGVAHLGVLEALARARVPIDLICGSSSGAVIALLYADGGLPAVSGFLAELTRLGLVNDEIGLLLNTPGHLFRQLRATLRRFVTAKSFAQLPIAFSCVAADIITGEMIVLSEGDPVAAVMASIALPGIFPIQTLGGRRLIDGGVVRNLPADVVRAQGATFVIGSSLYCLPPLPGGRRSARLGRLQIAWRALEIMGKALSEGQIALCDFCFMPPMEMFNMYDLADADRILDVSRRYVLQKTPELLLALQQRRHAA